MPLRYSYKVELKRLQDDIQLLELDLARSPDNLRAKKLIAAKKFEAAWFQKRIDQGEDPGPRIE